MAEEYTREELVQSLRREGARLMQDYFKPDPDLEGLIRISVGSNTLVVTYLRCTCLAA